MSPSNGQIACINLILLLTTLKDFLYIFIYISPKTSKNCRANKASGSLSSLISIMAISEANLNRQTWRLWLSPYTDHREWILQLTSSKTNTMSTWTVCSGWFLAHIYMLGEWGITHQINTKGGMSNIYNTYTLPSLFPICPLFIYNSVFCCSQIVSWKLIYFS